MAANGGIIGPTNTVSFGKCKVTSKTSSGDVTTQPGTRLAKVLVVAGGGGGGGNDGSDGGAGGGGAGGYRCVEISVDGNTAYTATVGGGGNGGSSCGPNPGRVGSTGSDSFFSIFTSNGGGGGSAKGVAAGAGGLRMFDFI